MEKDYVCRSSPVPKFDCPKWCWWLEVGDRIKIVVSYCIPDSSDENVGDQIGPIRHQHLQLSTNRFRLQHFITQDRLLNSRLHIRRLLNSRLHNSRLHTPWNKLYLQFLKNFPGFCTASQRFIIIIKINSKFGDFR